MSSEIQAFAAMLWGIGSGIITGAASGFSGSPDWLAPVLMVVGPVVMLTGMLVEAWYRYNVEETTGVAS